MDRELNTIRVHLYQLKKAFTGCENIESLW